LEYQVGVELLTRTAAVLCDRGGRAFLDHARLALAQVEAATGGSAPRGAAGQTRVCGGLSDGMGNRLSLQ